MFRLALCRFREGLVALVFCLHPCLVNAQTSAAEFLAQGQFAEALALTTATANTQPNPNTALLRGFAYLGLGDAVEAQAAATQARYAHNQFLYKMLRGHIALRNTQMNRAAFWYRRAYDVAGQSDERTTAANFARLAAGTRKWVWGVELNIQKSDNLNLSTTRDSVDLGGVPFTIAESSKAQSGTAISAAFSGKYKLINASDSLLQIGAVLQIAGQGGYGMTVKSLGLTLDGQRILPRETGAPYVLSYGLTASRSQPNTGQHVNYRSVHLQVSRVTETGQRWSARLDASQNGTDQTDLSFTLCLLGQMRDGLNYNLSASQKQTRSDNANVASKARTIQASVQPKFNNLPFTTSLFAEFSQKRYTNETPFFGGMRSDDIASFGITVAPQDFTLVGMTPSLTLRKTTRASNIEINDATSVDIYVGLRSSF